MYSTTSYSPTVHLRRSTQFRRHRHCMTRTRRPPGRHRRCTTYTTITSNTAAMTCHSTPSLTCATRPCPRYWAWIWTTPPTTWTWTCRSKTSSYPCTKTTCIRCCRMICCGEAEKGHNRPNLRRLRQTATTAATTTTGEKMHELFARGNRAPRVGTMIYGVLYSLWLFFTMSTQFYNRCVYYFHIGICRRRKTTSDKTQSTETRHRLQV